MEYTLYTHGNGDIIAKVLNVLALLCKTENLFFRPIFTLTATLGGTWVAIRAMIGHTPALFLRDWMLPTVLIINLFFVPRVTVNIIDTVDTAQHYIRVDHVPVGPALIGHITSNLSHTLTETIEEKLVPASYGNLTYGRTGPMFAAHLVMAAQHITIADPILRDNMKAYIDQCYIWPYLYTNIPPGREAALHTPNILEFMRAHPHAGLGMYWKGPTGQSTFCHCRDIPSKLGPPLQKESIRALERIATQVMPHLATRRPEQTQRTMRILAESAWHTIAKDSATAHQRTEQLMVINAGREAIDDALEGFGNERRFGRLISASATRAEQQQNTGFLITGLTAARQLPLLQGVFLSLLLASFALVVGCTFIPGGLKIWGMWIKMILWVESWPVFFGILNGIGLLYLEKSLQTITQSEGGITWISEAALSESCWTAYSMVQNFFLAVPFLSWAIISRSGHALVSLSERALPTMGQALGQSIIDNTPVFDTQSFHNRSLNSFQMAQQQLGSSYTLGSFMDDGQFRVTSNPTGYQTIQEYMSTGRHAINMNEGFQSQWSRQLTHEQQALDSLSHSYMESQNAALDQSLDLTKAFARGQAQIHGSSTSEHKELQHAAQKILSANERYAKQHGLSEGIAWKHATSAGIRIFGTGVTTEGGADASNQDMRQFTRDTGISRDVADRLSHGLSAARTHQAHFSEDTSQRVAESYRASAAHIQNTSKQISAQNSTIERFQTLGALMNSQGISITQNLNDDVLDTVAAQTHWTKEQVGRWASQNPTAFREQANHYIDGWVRHMGKWLTSHTGPIDSTQVDGAYQDYKSHVMKTTPVFADPSSPLHPPINYEGMGSTHSDEFRQNIKRFQKDTGEMIARGRPDFSPIDISLAKTEQDLSHTYNAVQKEFNKFKEKNIVRRAGKVIVDKSRDNIRPSNKE